MKKSKNIETKAIFGETLKIEGEHIQLSRGNNLLKKNKKNSLTTQDGYLFIVPWQQLK